MSIQSDEAPDESDICQTVAGDNPFDIYAQQIQEFSAEKKDYSNIRSRNWCITWNNYPADWKERLRSLPGLQYVIGFPETGKLKATPHIQGFIRFKNERTLGSLNKDGTYHKQSLMGMDIVKGCFFIKEIYGTPFRWIQYCKKQRSPDFLEFGEMKGQGQRDDLRLVTDAIATQLHTVDEIAQQFPTEFVKYHRGIERFFASFQKHRSERPLVHWLYGRSGVGKTGYAFEYYEPADIYIKSNAASFWNDYQNQYVVVINEFCSAEKQEGGWRFTDFLQLIDRHPYIVNVKGSYGRFNSGILYITSPYPPEYFYPEDIQLEQVIRRLDSVIHVKAVDEAVERTDYKFPYASLEAVKPITWTTAKMDVAKSRYELMKSAKEALRRKASAAQSSSSESRSAYSDE